MSDHGRNSHFQVMASTKALTSTPLKHHLEVRLIASGKVREIYELKSDPSHFLFVTTDRISAFDVVLASAIPQKGAVLTMLSKFWFELIRRDMPSLKTHFVAMGLPESLKQTLSQEDLRALEHRSMVVKRLEVLPIESICRGYITGQLSRERPLHDSGCLQGAGSAWSSYRKDRTVNGEWKCVVSVG